VVVYDEDESGYRDVAAPTRTSERKGERVVRVVESLLYREMQVV
jgi:hypothetical protein